MIATKEQAKCIEHVGAVVTSVDETTGVTHSTIVRWESPRDDRASTRLVVKHLVITFKQRGEEFVATKFDLGESELAAQLVAHPELAPRILNDNGELLTRDLASRLANVVNEAVVHSDLKMAETAAQLLDVVAVSLDDSDVRSLARSVHAFVKGRLGDARMELAYADEALALADERHDPDVLLRALVEVGHAYERTAEGDDQAQNAYDRASLLADQVENRFLLGHLFISAASLRQRHGDSIGTLAKAKEAEAVFKEQDDDAGLALVSQILCTVFTSQGDDRLARMQVLRGLDAAKRLQNDALRTQLLTILANVDYLLGNETEAKKSLDESLSIARRTNDFQAIGECLRVSGTAHFLGHRYADAIHDYEEAIKAHRTAARPRLATIVMVALTRAKLASGDARGAIETGQATGVAARQLGLHTEFVQVKELTGRAHHLLAENDKALADFNDAIEEAEVRRTWIAGDPAMQERAFEEASVPYRLAAELYADLGHLDEAFTMAERAKARVLLDTLRSDRSRIDEAMTPVERRSDHDFALRIAALNRRMAAENARPSPDTAAIAKVTVNLRSVRDEYETFATTLYAAHARLRQTRGDVPIATRGDVARMLDPHSAIVMYQVMEHKTIALLLRQHDIKRYDIELDRDALARKIVDYASSLANRNIRYRGRSRALYDLLLRPMESALIGVKVLCITPDDVLWQVPFESLIDSHGRFLIQSRACFYAQSVSVLSESMRSPHATPAPHALLAIGNPTIAASQKQSSASHGDHSLQPLPQAEREVRALKALYPGSASRIYVGSAASETAVKSEISNYRILHFATHAEFNNENPLYAHIVLAQTAGSNDDGLLEAWEIMRMQLHADIAVLSACDTARGRVASGEGLIGFSWALFVAGCPSSVVSLWKVSSTSTEKLMVDFHRHLLSERSAFQRAEALRKAKLDMLKNRHWAHPFFWSPFVLVGRG